MTTRAAIVWGLLWFIMFTSGVTLLLKGEWLAVPSTVWGFIAFVSCGMQAARGGDTSE